MFSASFGFNPKEPFDPPELLIDQVPLADWESTAVLKACIDARAALAALNQAIALLPKPDILLSPLLLLESQASSEIENIVTTTDELFRYAERDAQSAEQAVKETMRYRESLFFGMKEIKKRPLSTSVIEQLCSLTKGVEMQVRKVPGTAMVNSRTGQAIYTPPQGENMLREKLADWERFYHAEPQDNSRGGGLDPLVRMAVLHYQFEAIHPFLDGNGRTGRILNLLFMVDKGLLAYPILYLSRYILQHRPRYYELLLAISQEGSLQAWQEWLIYMLKAVHESAQWTLEKIQAIRELRDNTRILVEQNTKLGRQPELMDLIFRLPYCRVADVVEAGIAKRQTAAVYLQTLAKENILLERIAGREKLYLNHALITLLKNAHNNVEPIF